MPQETNFNVSPYFDDFDANKNYYKVLFKPGYPIQARELTTLQSILQNQVEQFGNHVFKEGSPVIDGQLTLDIPFAAVEIDSDYNGAPVSLYFDSLLNKRLRGSESGVIAKVEYVLNNTNSERGNYTLYLTYLQSGGENFTNQYFVDGETLLLEDSLTYSNVTIQVGQGVCTTISTNASSSGSSVSVKDGIYFVRGIFAEVSEQRILLDQYSTEPSYKVGFNVIEQIVTSDEDESLYDNAQGYSNYGAPGADRFKLTLELSKKNLDDNETGNFVELLRVISGVPQFFTKKTQYNLIRDELAKRTFDQSGDFFVNPFTLFVRDSLNDRLLNTTGVYYEGQQTVNGNTPSDDSMVYEVGPGKAYVNGYDVESISPKLLDIDKARTTATLTNQVLPFNAGSLVVLNNVYGFASIGLGTTAVVSLMDSRLGSSKHVAAGTTIGYARVYDCTPETNFADQTTRVDLRLYDIQTFTTLTLTTSITQTAPAFIKGKRSNASGYLKDGVSGLSTLTLYQVAGTFLPNEQIIINGIDDGRLISSVRDYSVSDIKSVYSQVGVSTFNADLVLDTRSLIAQSNTQFNITAASGGISTVSSGLGTNFRNRIVPGDIISYTNPIGGGNVIYNKVETVSAGGTNFTIAAVTDVVGVCTGSLPTSDVSVVGIIKLTSSIDGYESSLLTEFDRENLSSVNLENNELLQRRIFSNQSFAGSSITLTLTEPDVYFASYQASRFVITYSDGSVEPLRSDKYNVDTTGKQVTFNGLTKASGTADVIVTVKNLKANSKVKNLNKVNSIIVSHSKYTTSGIGTTTLNDGLNYSQVYGVRVQDEEISLNYADAIAVLGVFESSSTSDPTLPQLQLTQFSGASNNNQSFAIGEQILGRTSGAIGIIVNRISVDKLEYVYLNSSEFSIGEIIEGKESTTTATITGKVLGDKNITENFNFDHGQKRTHYDYSRIIRKPGFGEPTKKLRIIFQNYTIDASDTGEVVTVNSYPTAEYKTGVIEFENKRVSDYIDIRPRVSPYTLSSRSPFEFNSRNFAADGQYSRYILAPEENLIVSYSYYLPRIDRVFLNQDGTFEVVKGIPADYPFAPQLKVNALDIAQITIPPYVFNVKNVIVNMSRHKRYRMNDISLLEDRIQRVEEVTSLSMLESRTENFSIKDAETGLDRFKCGFFVDNFSSHIYQDLQNPSFRCSIDSVKNELRPLNYTTSIDLQLGSEAISGIGSTFAPNVDQSFVTDLGSPGIRKTGDLITLNYSEVLYGEQSLATRDEFVTAFLVSFYSGTITLEPSVDTWFDERAVTTNSSREVRETVTHPDVDIPITASRTESVTATAPPNQSAGLMPMDYLAAARGDLMGRTSAVLPSQGPGGSLRVSIVNGNTIRIRGRVGRNALIDPLLRYLPRDTAERFIREMSGRRAFIDYTPPAIVRVPGTTTTTPTTRTETNTRTILMPETQTSRDTTSQSISHYTQPILRLRSRNIAFNATRLKPVTRFYSFFQGIDVNRFIIPKLLEVTMLSGTFQVGETIVSDPTFTAARIRFRLCTPNHRTGPYDAPTATFGLIPYTQQASPTSYTSSSTFLNVDTVSLQLPSEPNFFGRIAENMTLIGQTSGARARISNIRLISDNSGNLLGSLFIPDPTVTENPSWNNGTNTFTLTDVPTLNTPPGATNVGGTYLNQSSGSSDFTSSGTTNVTETNILTTRTITITPAWRTNIVTTTNVTTNTTTTNPDTWEYSGSGSFRIRPLPPPRDPIAQSFFVEEDSGIYLTSVEVFFKTVPNDPIPVTLQIRPMAAGVPSNMIIPFSEVTIEPEDIRISADGSVPTRFTFPSPVFLAGPQQQALRQAPVANNTQAEYAMVLLSDSTDYRVFISRLNENDLITGNPVSAQPTLGSLFKSQVGTTWTPSQYDDLKYRIYRANFVNEGLVRFFNPIMGLGNNRVTVTGQNQLLPLSKKIIVGLGSTGYDTTNVVPGVTLSQGLATGTLTGIAGSITVGSGVTVSQPGVGYTNGTFTNVALVSETGYGQGATATVITTSNAVDSVTITNGGSGYQVGDSLLVPNIGQNVGFGAKVVVTTIASNNTFVIDNVQGTFVAGIGTVNYINSSGVITQVGAAVTISSITQDQFYDGLHMKISQVNHGMHSPTNYVTISEMRPLNNDTNTTASDAIAATETSSISVVDGTGFTEFEGVTVSATNPGYIIIGTEVIAYTSIAGNVLSNLTRGIDGTQAQPYDAGVAIYKYEFNGVSLRRINKTHNFAEVDVTNHPIDLNSYYIKIDMSDTDFEGVGIGSDRSNDLYFRNTIQTGESGTVITNNIQFEAIRPRVATILPAHTNIDAKIRTFSGTSIGGDEQSFVDQGYENITLDSDEPIYLDTPRIISSRVNETRLITGSPGNRSFEMQFLLSSTDSRVSPVIDTINVSAELISNLINNPVGILSTSEYANDDTVRSLYADKHTSIYISKPVRLKLPANSLKVVLSASRDFDNDVRVLYRLFRDDSVNGSQNYELFPGYSNYRVDGLGIKRVIDPSLNDGSADSFVQETDNNAFKDYEYSIDDLPDFNAFSIKIVMAGRNQAKPPIIRDLRAIATIRPRV